MVGTRMRDPASLLKLAVETITRNLEPILLIALS